MLDISIQSRIMINLPFPPTTNGLTGVFNGRKIK